MKNVMTEIAAWAIDLPYWEQAALDKIIAGENFSDADYDQLLEYLLEDAGLKETASARPLPRFHRKIDQYDTEAIPINLLKITNLENVNALVGQQSITFSPQLTTIFGANGSGKSGYARVIGSAAFTRGDREVLPDVTKPVDDNPILRADIEVSIGGESRVVNYTVGHSCPVLASFYVFDSTSVHAHMCEQNPLSFSPAGLANLTLLADVTDEVRCRLNARISACNQPPDFIHLYPGDTLVGLKISTIGPDTDFSELQTLATLSHEEIRRKSEISIAIANLELDQIHQQLENLDRKIYDLGDFEERLRRAQEMLNSSENQILDEVETYLSRREAAKLASVDQFKTIDFTQTGTHVWHNFIHAARRLAEAESDFITPYPQEDSRCLLCQQPLTSEARNLILRLWSYLEGEAQAAFSDSQINLERRERSLSSLNLFELDHEFSTPYQHLGELSPNFLTRIRNQVNSLRQRRDALLFALDQKQLVDLPPLADNCCDELAFLIEDLKTQKSLLQNKNLDDELKRLEVERLELEHRERLREILPRVKSHIENCRWAQEASTIGGSTHHITVKHNQLFEELVTKRYIQLFEQTLADMGRPLKVKIETRGRKGQTVKQVILVASKSARNIAKPEKVLSEGEKRAVALTDFLTEVALDTSSSGIILDDPVTSLDLEWRETIATILVREAKRRQVIVFTHDMPFLYYLKSYADDVGIQTESHWIKRGDFDNKPGYVYLNNCPALERDYRKASRARELCELAKKADAAAQQAILKEGFGALRTSYEAFVVFEVLNEVVMRFNERISIGRLTGIVWDPSLIKDVDESYARISRYIEGHLHSDQMSAKIPTPELLLQEIEGFNNLRKHLAGLKN